MRKYRQPQHGYAIVLVLILMIIATGILLFANKENLFFTKIVGFFNRSKQTQSVAESGLKLAELDLRTLSQNVLLDDYSSVDVFTDLVGESIQLPIDQGLHVYNVTPGSRIITPRITKSDGPIDLEVTYFADDPCEGTCASKSEYNEKMPKFFTIVSQATHRETGEVFTIESRIQVRLENYSEIAYGVTGVGNFPYNPWRYNFIPSVYGRVHLNIPNNNIQFLHGGWVDDNGGAYPSKVGDSNVHTFLGPVTFENSDEHDFGGDENLPFYRENKEIGRWDIYLRPELEFTKGLDYPVNLVAEPGDPGYKAELDPSTTEYFNVLQSTASSGYGVDLSGTGGSCQTNSVTGNSEVNICLKMQGTDLLQYDCNNVDPDVGEFFMQPSVDQVIWANDSNIATAIASFPDRYTGERADVIAGNTNNATSTHTLGGVIYCRETSCDCNLHIKGIYAETVTFAADNVVIEGDIVSADQDPINSPYTLGVIAKENIIIPQGIPQGANPSPLSAWSSQYTRSDMTTNQPPFSSCTTPGAGCTPSTLAESYLNITNFIADDGTNYVDRDFGNDDYLAAVPWFDYTIPGHTTNYYNSPSALDLDGHFIAGETLVIDGIFNPEQTYQDKKGMVILTCENPPTCNEYRYREPLEEFNDSGTRQTNDPLYVEVSPGVWEYARVGGVEVQPVFYADGKDLPAGSWVVNPGDAANYNGTLDFGEELPRMKNEILHVFGSLSAKYFYTKARINQFDVGFRTKIINGDSRAGNFNPPGFPFTLHVIYDELYRKSMLGKSALLP